VAHTLRTSVKIVGLFGIGAVVSFGLAGQPASSEEGAVTACVNRLFEHYKKFAPEARARVFTDNVISFYSDGEVLDGPKAHADDYVAVAKIERDFTFKWTPQRIEIRRDLAWTVGELHWASVLVEGNQPRSRTVRSTFILRKVDGQWRIAHEHSSKYAEPK